MALEKTEKAFLLDKSEGFTTAKLGQFQIKAKILISSFFYPHALSRITSRLGREIKAAGTQTLFSIAYKCMTEKELAIDLYVYSLESWLQRKGLDVYLFGAETLVWDRGKIKPKENNPDFPIYISLKRFYQEGRELAFQSKQMANLFIEGSKTRRILNFVGGLTYAGITEVERIENCQTPLDSSETAKILEKPFKEIGIGLVPRGRLYRG